MIKLSLKLLALCLVLSCVSCAGNYNYVQPRNLTYQNTNKSEGLSYSYKFDVLRLAGNNKYARKEEKNSVSIIALKITNRSEKTINVGSDIAFFIGQTEVRPMEPLTARNSIKQSAPSYLLYLLLTPLGLQTESGSVIPIGLGIGPGIALANTAIASSGNKRLLRELEGSNIMAEDIAPGETAYGLIGLRDAAFNPINLKLR